MTTPSPSEFLTFMRHAAGRSTLRRASIQPRQSIAIAQRRFQNSGVKTDQYEQGKKDHASFNKSGLDIQSDASNKGKAAKAAGGTDHATAERDLAGSTSKAKKDHPEAPDVVIGMQDERGGRGH